MNGGMILSFIPLEYKLLCIDKMILLLVLSQSYTTSALTIMIVSQVPSVFIKTNDTGSISSVGYDAGIPYLHMLVGVAVQFIRRLLKISLFELLHKVFLENRTEMRVKVISLYRLRLGIDGTNWT